MFKRLLQRFTDSQGLGSRSTTKRAERRPKPSRRRLQLERLEKREVLAGNLGAIMGTAFIDLTNNGLTPDDTRIAGAEIRLWRDGGNGVFNGGPDDTLVSTTNSAPLASPNPGSYRFDNLSPGLYFLEQVAGSTPTGFLIPAPVPVTVVNDVGLTIEPIDTFDQTDLLLEVSSGSTSAQSFLNAPEALGGVRKAELSYTDGPSTVQLFVDPATQRLGLSSAFASHGSMIVRYDGNVSNIALDPTGLGGVNLSDNDPNAGVLIEVYRNIFITDQTFNVTIYSDGNRFSTIERAFRPDLINEIYRDFIPFSSFTTQVGPSGAADFASVGAIELEVANGPDQNIRITVFESREPELVMANLSNLGVTLGNQVFRDLNNNGIFDTASETGIANVPVQLYRTESLADVVDPLTDTLVGATTTAADGTYQFLGLPSGFYAAVVPASAFATGGPLQGTFSSNPATPTAGANAKIDNDDDGRTVAGQAFIITESFQLIAGQEPGAAGLVNNTVDFGFLAATDLDIDKEFVSLVPGVGGDFVATFRVLVANDGSIDSTGLTVVDTLPAGFTYRSIGSLADPNVPPTAVTNVTVGSGIVTFQMADLAAGDSTGFLVTFDVADGQFGERINRVTATGDEVELDPSNNTAEATLRLSEADLRLVKTVETLAGNPIPPASVLTGDQIVYRLVVTNDGPDSATGVTVVDTLPTDITFVSATINGGAAGAGIVFDPVARTVTADVGTLLNDATATILITATVGAGAAGSISNTATVSSSPQNDPDTTNNSGNASTAVARGVDLAINKAVVAGSVASFGGQLSYEVTVTNAATAVGNARGFTVVDVLPAGLSYVPGSFDDLDSGITLSVDGQQLTFTGVPLALGAAVPFRYSVQIAQNAPTTVTNTATVTAFSSGDLIDIDQNTADNQDSETITPIRSVNLTVAKSDGIAAGGSHTPGTQLVYSITITNTGPSNAVNVNVIDTLPAGVVATAITLDGTQITDNNPDAGILSFVVPSVPAGTANAITVQVTTQVGSALTGSITNSVTISGGGVNDPPEGNSATETTTLTPVVDASITKTGPANAIPGQGTIQYTLTVTNTGPSVATNVTVTDVLPAGLQFESLTLNGTPVTNAGTGNNVQFVIPTLLIGTANAQTLVITASVLPGATGTLTNSAQVAAAGDSNTANNAATAPVLLQPLADVGVTKTVSAATAIPGNELTYTVIINNAGPSVAAGVTLVDVLPSGVTFVSGTGPGGQVLTANGQNVEVAVGNLDPAAPRTYTIVARVNQGFSGAATNNATVATTTNEGQNTLANTASAVTQVTIPDPNTAAVSGRIFNDLNGNGLFDAGEQGVAGVTVNLLAAGTQNQLRTTTTDAQGNYQFANLPAGTYDIQLVRPAGFDDGLESLAGAPPANLGNGLIPGVVVPQGGQIASNTFALIELISKRRFLASAN